MLGVAAGLFAAAGSAAADAPPEDQAFYLTFLFSEKCVSVPNDTAADVQLTQWTCLGKESQRYTWLQLSDDADWGLLRNVGTGKCVAVAGGSSASGAAIVQTTCAGADRAQWFHFPTDRLVPETWYWLVNAANGKAVSVPGGATANGTKLIQDDRRLTPNQYVKWTRA